MIPYLVRRLAWRALASLRGLPAFVLAVLLAFAFVAGAALGWWTL